MAKLTDLPEELLSYICDETVTESLVPLALTCRQLNRLAGSRYLGLINISSISLRISPMGSGSYSISFGELQNVLRILHSLSNLLNVACTFSSDSRIALHQMKTLTIVLRRMTRKLSSFTLDFRSVPKAPSKRRRKDQIFHKTWEDLIREAQRLRFESLHIHGVPPFLPHAPIGKFGLSQSTSLTFCTISRSSFLFDQPHRDWLKDFLNSSPSISHFCADYAQEWTRLLPKIHLPSLRVLQFYVVHGYTAQAQTSLEVLAEFCDRHQMLTRLICGTGFIAPSTTASGTRQHYQLSNLRYIKAAVAQLRYFLSSSDCPNLRTIEIETSPLDLQIWKLFPLLNQHPSVQRLILHHDKPGLVRDIDLRNLKSMKLLHVRFIALEYHLWPYRPEAVNVDLLRWAAQMMIGAQVLEVLGISDLKDENKASLARLVAEEWPSIKFLRIYDEIRHLKSWFEEEPDLEGEDRQIPIVPKDRGWVLD